MLCQKFVLIISFVVTSACHNARADQYDPYPPQIQSTIESVGLFKNGLAVVRRSLILPGSGVYDVVDLPEPVHGTFWVDSPADVKIIMTNTPMPIHDEQSLRSVSNEDLAGARVAVHFEAEHLEPVTGTVVSPAIEKPSKNEDRNWTRPRHDEWWSGYSRPRYSGTTSSDRHLVIDTDSGRLMLYKGTIAYVKIMSAPTPRSSHRPVMRLMVADNNQHTNVPVEILYLTKGASWSPSYVLDISDTSELVFRQKAVICNEIEEWDDVEVLLITGHPEIEFGHVLSPMSLATNLSTFFNALGVDNRVRHMSRAESSSRTGADRMTVGVEITEEDVPHRDLAGIDVHYLSVGKQSLCMGETMVINTAQATAPYEHVVHLYIKDDRNEVGRSARTQTTSRNKTPVGEVWDAILFCNPLDRPITTAPAMTIADGLVKGQSMIGWSAPGGQKITSVNKTLSVRTYINEVMQLEDRQEIKIRGRKFFLTPVDGTMELLNHRNEPVTMLIELDFSGDLVEASDDPQCSIRRTTQWSVNLRRRLTWSIQLEPGEQRELVYSYSVLVNH